MSNFSSISLGMRLWVDVVGVGESKVVGCCRWFAVGWIFSRRRRRRWLYLHSHAWRSITFLIHEKLVWMTQVTGIHLAISWVQLDVHRVDLLRPCLTRRGKKEKNLIRKKIFKRQTLQIVHWNWYIWCLAFNMRSQIDPKRHLLLFNKFQIIILLLTEMTRPIMHMHMNHSSSRREASVINRECLSDWQMDANSSTSFAFVATASTCTHNRPIQRPTLIAESSVPSLFAFAIDTNCTCNSRWFIEQTGDDRRYIESVSVSRCRQHLRPTDSIGFCTVWLGIFGFRTYGAGSRLWIFRSKKVFLDRTAVCVCQQQLNQLVQRHNSISFSNRFDDGTSTNRMNGIVLSWCVAYSIHFHFLSLTSILFIAFVAQMIETEWVNTATLRVNQLKCLCAALLLISIRNFRFQFSMCFYRVCLNPLRLFTKTWPKLWTTSDWRSCTEWWQMLIGSASHQSSNEAAETFASLPSFARRGSRVCVSECDWKFCGVRTGNSGKKAYCFTIVHYYLLLSVHALREDEKVTKCASVALRISSRSHLIYHSLSTHEPEWLRWNVESFTAIQSHGDQRATTERKYRQHSIRLT